MRVIAIDIDGTALAYPEKVNALFSRRDTVIILHTARPESLRNQTVFELEAAGVLYNALVMDKLKADYYIDDKNATFELDYLPLTEEYLYDESSALFWWTRFILSCLSSEARSVGVFRHWAAGEQGGVGADSEDGETRNSASTTCS